jgi:formylglycine-generating enzyme required for sulfatase activity
MNDSKPAQSSNLLGEASSCGLLTSPFPSRQPSPRGRRGAPLRVTLGLRAQSALWLNTFLPLLWGEGWGEGKQNVLPHVTLKQVSDCRTPRALWQSCRLSRKATKNLTLLSAAATIGLLLSSCGKSGPDTAAGTSQPPASGRTAASDDQPFQVVTKSGVEMVYLPGGEFSMGSAQGNPDEAPPHKVRISPFLIDKFEVSHEMFAKAQLPNPSHWQDSPKKPVERVRWRDAKQYCNERSLLEGLNPCYNEKTADWDCTEAANGYRLPTEAEWEYAARAGTEGAYEFGTADKLRQYAWFAGNSDQKTHPVGQKKSNRWGLHDMYGNISEWCEDVYSPTYYKESTAVDPHGPPNPGKDVKRSIRGGSWKSSPDVCRSTARQGEKTGDADACFSTDYCGFRCVRRATPEELKQMSTRHN